MDIEHVSLPEPPSPIYDLDLAEDGGCVAVAAVRHIESRVHQDQRYEIQELRDQQLFIRGRWLNNPVQSRFPIIRAMPDGCALVVIPRVASKRDRNAALVDHAGKIVLRFAVGDGVEDVLVVGEHIVFTYFDEGVFSLGNDYGNQGIAVFDLSGNFEFGYHEKFGDVAVSIADCYAAAQDVAARLLFSAYTEFDLVRLDLDARLQEVQPLPEELHAAKALSERDGVVYLWGVRYSQALHALHPDGRSEFIDFIQGPLRGLTDGRFLRVEPAGYSIVRC